MLDACATSGVTRLLVDAASNGNALSAAEYESIARFFAGRPGARWLRIAGVRRAELIEQASVLEPLTARRRVTYRVFSNRDEALEWLKDEARQ
jgi:hypothetical protein